MTNLHILMFDVTHQGRTRTRCNGRSKSCQRIALSQRAIRLSVQISLPGCVRRDDVRSERLRFHPTAEFDPQPPFANVGNRAASNEYGIQRY
jgi:hypothetical protein